MTKHPLAGSEQQHPKDARSVGPCDPNEPIEVTVMLRRKDEAAFRALMKKIDAGQAPPVPVSREEFAEHFGASKTDIDAVRQFASHHSLTVVRAEAATRSVVLRGTVAQFENAFDVKLERFEHHNKSYRGRSGQVNVPEEIHPMIKAVLGLDNRPIARPHFRIRPPFHPAAVDAQPTSFTPLQLAQIYNFPQGNGAGQCIALIELGGGYATSDLQQYFSGLGVAQPNVVSVSVDQATNSPNGDPNGADGEVTLDVEVAGAIAPGATIAVYFSTNSESGFVDAVNQAIHDTTNKPSVVSISWGTAESDWPAQSINAFNDVLQSAATLGVTVCVAAGDSGSGDGTDDGTAVADFPASSPYVLACGGTHLTVQGTTIKSETVWNDGAQGGAGGGGISTVFALPTWQQGLSAKLTQGNQQVALTFRGVPDVAGDASPDTGYQVLVAGQNSVVGGTSAVAPLWAGLIARINAINGNPVGLVNPKLYAASSIGHDITSGNNGAYEATPGWDACTGLGTPDGAQVASALQVTSTQAR